MEEGAARRGSGGRHPRPRPGTRQFHPPRWTLGTYASSEVGRALARRHRTVQNIWKKRLRISGTHIGLFFTSSGFRPFRSPELLWQALSLIAVRDREW